MSAAPACFPLLKLESNVLKNVLGSMRLVDILLFSLISARTKALVKSQRLQALEVTVTHYSVDLSFGERPDQTLRCMFNGFEFNSRHLFSPPLARLVINMNARAYSPTLEVDAFCQHLASIFTWKSSVLLVRPLEGLTVRRTLEVFGNFDIVRCYSSTQFRYPADVLDALNKHAKSVWFHRNPYDREEIQKVLIQNLDALSFGKEEGEEMTAHWDYWIRYPVEIRLDDLLTVNAKRLTIREARISEAELNRFFKVWQRTRSNPRLQHLSIRCVREDFEVSNRLTLNGIEGIEYPDDEPRFVNNQEIYGGLDICRTDGTVATIAFDVEFQSEEEFFDFVTVQFFVWS